MDKLPNLILDNEYASEEPKYIDIKEFREKGYLQELNRRFLHPLGLALEVILNDDGTEVLNGIWDYRDDPEGICYDFQNSTRERKIASLEKHNFIEMELFQRKPAREKALGFFVEPVLSPMDNDDATLQEK